MLTLAQSLNLSGIYATPMIFDGVTVLETGLTHPKPENGATALRGSAAL
jgi:hypothetical protein